jgi:TatD DNase family protein
MLAHLHWEQKMNSSIDYATIPSGIIDSHAHLVLQYCADDPGQVAQRSLDALTTGQQQIIERSLAANVRQIVNPGVDLESIPELIALAEKYTQIYIGVGLHPHDAKNWHDDAEGILRTAAQHPKVVAIGECGLDFYYNNTDRTAQLKALRMQMQIARDLNKPLIIHCRDAFDDLRQLLATEGKGLTGVLHCFTGNPSVLDSFEEFDFYISFSGIVTFPNAREIQAAGVKVRKERLLVETDCPFLAPQKVRGKRNEPAYVWMVAEKLAELRSVSLAEIAETCSTNARALFRLPAV